MAGATLTYDCTTFTAYSPYPTLNPTVVANCTYGYGLHENTWQHDSIAIALTWLWWAIPTILPVVLYIFMTPTEEWRLRRVFLLLCLPPSGAWTLVVLWTNLL